MGEIKKNIYIVGCPSIDALNQEVMLSKEYIKKKFSIDLEEKYLILIQHPVTSEVRSNEQISNTLKALEKFNIAKLIIFPNNDAGSKKIIKVLKNSKFKIVKTLNLREYKTLLSNASLLVGNSSSGIHEAATYKLPVVNIGSRQNGRLKSINVINSDYSTQDIIKKIKFVLNNLEFKRKIKSIKNPYGDGNSASKITLHLSKIKINKVTTQKKITY